MNTLQWGLLMTRLLGLKWNTTRSQGHYHGIYNQVKGLRITVHNLGMGHCNTLQLVMEAPCYKKYPRIQSYYITRSQGHHHNAELGHCHMAKLGHKVTVTLELGQCYIVKLGHEVTVILWKS